MLVIKKVLALKAFIMSFGPITVTLRELKYSTALKWTGAQSTETFLSIFWTVDCLFTQLSDRCGKLKISNAEIDLISVLFAWIFCSSHEWISHFPNCKIKSTEWYTIVSLTIVATG